MIAYLIKSGLCLALLLGVYLLFLEREKMHRFNRYFLLFALVFGLSIPLLTLNFGFEPSIPVTNFQQTETSSFPTVTDAPVIAEPQKEWPIQESLLTLYGAGFFFFLFRFAGGLLSIFHRVKHADSEHFRTSQLILVSEKIVPHSFLKYIFVSKKEYESGAIEDEILEHELVHISQKHSLDILFVEILKMVFWFNPVFYFYKKAIQLNHEFIADEQIARQTNTLSAYQEILLRHAHSNTQPQLVSSFNFSLTKKRFVMMSKKSNQTIMAFKKTLLIPFLIIPVFLFSGQSNAQDSTAFKTGEPVVPYLHIHQHPAKSNLALIKFMLNEETEVELMVHEENDESSSFMILENTLEKGRHEIAFDYSNLTENNYDFRFSFRGVITVEMKGAFIENGKLKTIGDTLTPPPPPKPIAPSETMTEEEKKMFNEAGITYQNRYQEYMGLDPNSTNIEELEAAYRKVREAAEKFTEVFMEIAGEDVIPPPIKLGPDPESRKLQMSSDEVQDLKPIMDIAHENWQQKWDAYWEIEPIESNLEKLKRAYFIAMESHKMLGEVQSRYYNYLDEVEPPLPPVPPSPEERIENN